MLHVSRLSCPLSSSKPLLVPFGRQRCLLATRLFQAGTPDASIANEQASVEVTSPRRHKSKRAPLNIKAVRDKDPQQDTIVAFQAQINKLEAYRAKFIPNAYVAGAYQISTTTDKTWTRKLAQAAEDLAQLRRQGVLLPPETLHRLFTAVLPRAELGQAWTCLAVTHILSIIKAAHRMGVSPPASLAADVNQLLVGSARVATKKTTRASPPMLQLRHAYSGLDTVGRWLQAPARRPQGSIQFVLPLHRRDFVRPHMDEFEMDALLDLAVQSRVPGLSFVPLLPVDISLDELADKQRQYCAMSLEEMAAWEPGAAGNPSVADMAWFVTAAWACLRLQDRGALLIAAFARRLAAEPRLQQQWGEWGQRQVASCLQCTREMLLALHSEPQLQAQLLRLFRLMLPTVPSPPRGGFWPNLTSLVETVSCSNHPAVLCEGVQLVGLVPGYWEQSGCCTLLGRAVAVLQQRLHWFSDAQVAAMVGPLLQSAKQMSAAIAANTAKRPHSLPKDLQLEPLQLEVLLRDNFSFPPYQVNGLLALDMGPPGEHPARGPAVDGDPSLDLLARMAVRVAAYLAGPHSEERDALRRALGLT